MEIESVKQTANQNVQTANVAPISDASGNTVKAVKKADKPVVLSNDSSQEADNSQNTDMALENKKVAQSTIDSTMSDINSKIKMSNTQLQYSIDEETQRISIKVIDQDTDKVIREIPPEETLEAIKKIWEIAGIIVDKKL